MYTNGQASLHTTTLYPNAHINVDSAWAITSGKPHVRVGIYDSGVGFDHEDLLGMAILGKKFDEGGPQGTPLDPTDLYDSQNHGTHVASIICARRNNGLGIAGIAGGDVDSNNIGATIYDCKVMDSLTINAAGTQNVLARALYKGSTGANLDGYALQIMNNSFVIGYNQTNAIKNPMIEDQIAFANRNGVAFVASKWNQNIPFPLACWPADWQPEIVSCVAGTGNDGHSCKSGINSNYTNSYGHNLDFVAPGSASAVTSCTYVQEWVQPGGYSAFSGNSAAVPHVSGVMALMMSYWNKTYPDWNNLVHEDCEAILKLTANDLSSGTYSETVGYDDRSGYGKINAYQALKKINKNYYRIRHIDTTHYAISYSKTQAVKYSSFQQYWTGYNGLYMPPGFTPSFVPAPITPGTYSAEVYEITTTLTYTLNPSEKIIGSWPLYKESYGWAADTVWPYISVDKPYYTKLDTVNSTTAKLKTYVWKNLNTGLFYPHGWGKARSAFVLYTYDSLGTVDIKEDKILQSNFQVYPNPSSNDFKLSFYTEHNNLLKYQIFDILGREIKEENFKPAFGNNAVNINFKGSYGIYILKVLDGNKLLYTQKLIKNDN